MEIERLLGIIRCGDWGMVLSTPIIVGVDQNNDMRCDLASPDTRIGIILTRESPDPDGGDHVIIEDDIYRIEINGHEAYITDYEDLKRNFKLKKVVLSTEDAENAQKLITYYCNMEKDNASHCLEK
jgi:hypothetical protein